MDLIDFVTLRKISPSSEVYIVEKSKAQGTRYVYKKVKKRQEIVVFKFVAENAPHLVPVLDTVLPAPVVGTGYAGGLMCECCEETLSQRLNRRDLAIDLRPLVTATHLKRLTLVEKQTAVSKIARLIFDLHSIGVVHRDLKPENIVICQGDYRLIDFGLSSRWIRGNLSITRVGTTSHMAPEVVRASPSAPYDPYVAEVWALGLIFFRIIFDVDFWSREPEADHLRDIERYLCVLPVDHSSASERYLMARIATIKHISLPRSSGDDLLARLAADLIMRMLNPNPDERIRMDDVMRHLFAQPRSPYARHSPALASSPK